MIENFEYLPRISMGINCAVIGLLAFGLWKRFRPRIHIPVMLTCFAVDLFNVLLVEYFARLRYAGEGAVEKGLRSLGEGAFTLLNFHILVSVAAIVSYGVAVFTGWRLWKRGARRRAHRSNAAVFIAVRLASFVTSFLV